MLGWIGTTRGVFRFLFGIGLLLIGGGAALALAGHVFLGLIVTAFGAGVMWAIGYSVVPFAEPGWWRATIRAWNDWGAAVKTAQATALRRTIDIAERVEALPVPTRFAAEAQPVIANLKPDLSEAERPSSSRGYATRPRGSKPLARVCPGWRPRR